MTTTGKNATGGGAWSALAVPSFRWWFLSQVTSASGLAVQAVAIAWVVLEWHGDGFDLAVITAANFLPLLFLGMWAGTLIDHHDRSTILIWTQTLLLLQSLCLYALIVSGLATYASVVVLATAGGVVNAVDTPTRQVYVLDLVGEERLAGAISLYEVVLNLSRVIGPAIGGALLATSGPAACLLANAISFLAPLAVLLVYRKPTHRPAGATRRVRPQMLSGLRYAVADPMLRACLLLAVAAGLVFNFGVLLPLLADRAFHLGAGGYGLLLSLFGAGALPGAFLAAHRGRRTSGRQIRVLAVATGAASTLAAVAPDRWVLYAGVLATGAASIWMISATNTLIQVSSNPEMRGRVMGAWSAALPGSVPLSGLAIGVLADTCGARVAYATAGGVVALTAVVCWRSFGGGRMASPWLGPSDHQPDPA